MAALFNPFRGEAVEPQLDSKTPIVQRMRSQANQLQESVGKQPKSILTVRGILFKYYIHDAVESCRFQLLGNFTQTQVGELSGCWRTARTTLGDRKLVLDLRGITSVDESAKQWIAVMTQEGAICWPDDFLRTWLGSPDTAAPQKVSVWTRLFAFLRGMRVPAVE